jgi:ankyrin repeat protein
MKKRKYDKVTPSSTDLEREEEEEEGEEEKSRKKQRLFLAAAPPQGVGADATTALLKASSEGKVQVVEQLLKNGNVDPSLNVQKPLRMACKNGHAQVVRLLLQDNRVDPSVDFQSPLVIACRFGRDQVVAELLKDNRVDPTIRKNKLLIEVCKKGYIEILKMFVSDPLKRMNPSALNHYALWQACQMKRLDLMKFLLDDPRINPCFRRMNSCLLRKQNILQFACSEGFTDGVKFLLLDPRIDPSSHHNQALEEVRTSHGSDIRDLLLHDPIVRNKFKKMFLFDKIKGIDESEKQRKHLVTTVLTVADLADIVLSFIPNPTF